MEVEERRDTGMEEREGSISLKECNGANDIDCLHRKHCRWKERVKDEKCFSLYMLFHLINFDPCNYIFFQINI